MWFGTMSSDQPETVLACGAGQLPQPLLTAELGPYVGVVHHVVAVRGARDGLQDRRQVQMRDTQRGQVRHGAPSAAAKGKRGLQLEPVSGGGRQRAVRLM